MLKAAFYVKSHICADVIMKEWYITFVKTVLPLIVNKTDVSRETPFLYDLSSEAAINTIAPSSPWPSTDFTVDTWNWTLQKTDGSSWQWEQTPGLWTTWFWRKIDGGIEYQGGGYRIIQTIDDEVWSEFTWEQIGEDAMLWVCSLRKPVRDETKTSVQQLASEPWMKNLEGKTWGMRKTDDNLWMFCNVFVCIDINYASCNWKIQSINTTFMRKQDWSDVPELEDMQNDVHFRTKRWASRKNSTSTRPPVANFLHQVVDFFFGGSDLPMGDSEGSGNSTCGTNILQMMRQFCHRMIEIFHGKNPEESPRPTVPRPKDAEELDENNQVIGEDWDLNV